MLERSMHAEIVRFESLTDDQVLTETKRLVACERSATAALLRSLMEIDARGLYLRDVPSSGELAGALKRRGSNSTTFSHTQMAARRRSITSSSAVARTISTKRSCGSRLERSESPDPSMKRRLKRYLSRDKSAGRNALLARLPAMRSNSLKDRS